MNQHIPVITGEWCLSNKYALKGRTEEEKAGRFRLLAQIQRKVWEEGAGSIYWNYQLLRDKDAVFDEEWKESWDLTRCWEKGYM